MIVRVNFGGRIADRIYTNRLWSKDDAVRHAKSVKSSFVSFKTPVRITVEEDTTYNLVAEV